MYGKFPIRSKNWLDILSIFRGERVHCVLDQLGEFLMPKLLSFLIWALTIDF